MTNRMTDERLAEIDKFVTAYLAEDDGHCAEDVAMGELLQALKAERQHAGLLDDSRLGAECCIEELEAKLLPLPTSLLRELEDIDRTEELQAKLDAVEKELDWAVRLMLKTQSRQHEMSADELLYIMSAREAIGEQE